MPVEQLRAVAARWYDDRLDPAWRRRSAGERQRILTEAGLTGPFWDLGS